MSPRSDSPASQFHDFPATEQDTRDFESPSLGEQNLNDSMRGLSLVDLQNLDPTAVDTYRIAILETVGF
ncbi:hypothetical protein N7507_010199 [Penicillium longicatenatum]|nr:hypothetical protein N7507_010199 [Penicillium longicatenatum]